MATSIYLARLIGPIMLVLSIGMLLNPRAFRQIVDEVLASPALIFLSGLLAITAGMSLVLAHNVWAADWRILITLLGWLSVIGGIVRIAWPQLTQQVATRVYANHSTLPIGGLGVGALGAVLSFFGYVR